MAYRFGLGRSTDLPPDPDANYLASLRAVVDEVRAERKPAKVFKSGMCDNISVFSSALSPAGMPLIFRTLNKGSFRRAAVTGSQVDILGFRQICMYYLSSITDAKEAYCQIIRETLAPYQSEELWETKESARRHFTKQMMYIATTAFASTLVEVSANLGVLWDSGPKGKELVRKFTGNADRPDRQARVLQQGEELTLNNAVLLLEFIGSHLSVPAQQRCVVPIVLAVVAVAKSGTVSQKWIEKLINDLPAFRQVLSPTLTPDNVKMVWACIGGTINDSNIESILGRWYNNLPQSALRLIITIRQAAGKDLTCLSIIKDFIIEHPTFPWESLIRLYPLEVQYVAKALHIVAGNKYFGFRKDPGDVRATNYRNVTWVAKTVLIRAGSGETLKGYRGFIETPNHNTTVNDVIDKYFSSKRKDINIEGEIRSGEKLVLEILKDGARKYTYNSDVPEEDGSGDEEEDREDEAENQADNQAADDNASNWSDDNPEEDWDEADGDAAAAGGEEGATSSGDDDDAGARGGNVPGQ